MSGILNAFKCCIPAKGCCYTDCCDINKDGVVNAKDFELLGKDADKLLATTRDTIHKLLEDLKRNVYIVRNILTMLKTVEGVTQEVKDGIDSVIRVLDIFETSYEGWKDITAAISGFQVPSNLEGLNEDLKIAARANDRAKELLRNLTTLGVNLPVKAEQLDIVNDVIIKAAAVRNIVEIGLNTPAPTGTTSARMVVA